MLFAQAGSIALMKTYKWEVCKMIRCYQLYILITQMYQVDHITLSLSEFQWQNVDELSRRRFGYMYVRAMQKKA